MPASLTTGERVLLARRRAGLTTEALAQQLATSRKRIERWESDRTSPPASILTALAAALGVSVGWLLGEDVAA